MMKKGFGLVEMLVVAAIFTFIITAVFNVLLTGSRGFETGDVQIEVEQEARRAIDYMVKELRQTNANKISTPASGMSASIITFEIPCDVDADGDVISATGGVEWSNDAGANRIGTITYSMSGGQILRALSLGGQAVLANRITALSFNRPLGKDLIEISLTAEKYALKGFSSAGNPKVTINLNSQVKVRN